MTVVLLIILLLVTIAMVGVILMQRSEGGALGIGGGPGNMMSGASAESLLTRTTMILGIVFMGTCIVLAILSGASSRDASLGEELSGEMGSGFGDFGDIPADTPAEVPSEVPADAPSDDTPEVPGL